MKIRTVCAELFHAERRTDERTYRHDEADKNCTFCPQSVFVIFMDLRVNYLCAIQYKVIGLFKRDGECSLRGADWVL